MRRVVFIVALLAATGNVFALHSKTQKVEKVTSARLINFFGEDGQPKKTIVITEKTTERTTADGGTVKTTEKKTVIKEYNP